jgi:threonine aldolase
VTTTPIDLRSDTVTKPTPAMRRAMAEAEVGDDVYGEDPTIDRLEKRIAELLGKEAALFVPSGTMANQIAIRANTSPGDEVILESSGHSFVYESGALAGISMVQAHPVPGQRGLLDPAAIERAIRPAPDHFARSRVVIVENTSNGGGGTIYTPQAVAAIADVAHRRGLVVHLDGARLFNAQVATGEAVARFAASCDTVSVALSKGLGAPVGSLIAGTRDFITRAHRLRKMIGGGMRQAGILAAAGLYALDHHVARLSEDHVHLRRLTSALSRIAHLECDPDAYPTNIAYVRVSKPGWTAATLVERLKNEAVLVNAVSADQIRVVTHLDVSEQQIEDAIARFSRVLA